MYFETIIKIAIFIFQMSLISQRIHAALIHAKMEAHVRKYLLEALYVTARNFVQEVNAKYVNPVRNHKEFSFIEGLSRMVFISLVNASNPVWVALLIGDRTSMLQFSQFCDT